MKVVMHPFLFIFFRGANKSLGRRIRNTSSNKEYVPHPSSGPKQSNFAQKKCYDNPKNTLMYLSSLDK